MRETVVAIAVLLGSAWLAPAAVAQERVIGLLALREVFGRGACDRFTPRPVQLHATPRGRGVGTVFVLTPWTYQGNDGCEGLEVAVRVTGGAIEPLPTEDYAYESPGAIVLERRGKWFRIRLSKGSAWLESSAQDEFFGLEQLFEERLTYLTEAWNGRVAATPGAADRPAAVSNRTENEPVRVRRTARATNGLWFFVEIMSSECEGVEPTVVDRGWVPAYGKASETTIWFYSRSC